MATKERNNYPQFPITFVFVLMNAMQPIIHKSSTVDIQFLKENSPELVYHRKFRKRDLMPRLYNLIPSEVENIKKCESKFTCPYTSISITEDEIDISRRYVGGFNLTQFVQMRVGANLKDTYLLCLNLTDALITLHSKNVFAKTLSPENIIIGIDSVPILVDFGISGASFDRLNAKDPAKAFLYESPEAIKGEIKEFTVQKDIYALGMLIYYVMSGKYPWPLQNLLRLLKLITTQIVQLPENWDPKLKALVAQMLSPNPDFRPSLKDVRTVLNTLHISAPLENPIASQMGIQSSLSTRRVSTKMILGRQFDIPNQMSQISLKGRRSEEISSTLNLPIHRNSLSKD